MDHGGLRRFGAMVVFEQAAQAVFAVDRAIARLRIGVVLREENRVVFRLMCAFEMVMVDVLRDRAHLTGRLRISFPRQLK